MKKRTKKTTEILSALGIPFWRLEHLIRAGKITPLNRGRGVERRFSQEEFLKAKRILKERNEFQYA